MIGVDETVIETDNARSDDGHPRANPDAAQRM
jgi:hypothetical protein